MRLYYIANARMPTEKAHGIQIAKMCEAFIDLGVDVTLVLPSRKNISKSIKDFYGLHVEVKTAVVPAFDWYDRGRVLYTLSTLSFACSYSLYLLTHYKRGDVVYTVDLDHLAYAPLPFLGLPYFSEMHGGKPHTLVHRVLFKRARGIIPTNTITRDQLKETFGMKEENLIVEPNGVDLSNFSPIARAEARRLLGLPQEAKIALYVGRFFDWKGLEIISEAVQHLPKDITIGIVGGSAEEYARITKKDPGRIVFYGEKPYTEIPRWASAADVLLVLGTKRDEQSYRYTSPMKVFEYMSIKRPIVASSTPAMQTILSEGECYFYEPDDAKSLALAIETAVSRAAEDRVLRAYEKVKKHSWSARAERVLAFLHKHETAS
jgi:glycosyltransferase involved in cell wall biosynthesis